MFSFNLQPVLNYRKTMEEKKLSEFADRQRKLEEEMELLENLKREKLLIFEQLREIQRNTFCAADVSFPLSYMEILNEKLVLQQKLVVSITEDVERLRKELIETIKNRKIMDILKERKEMEFRMDVASFERKAIEETAIQAFVRKKK